MSGAEDNKSSHAQVFVHLVSSHDEFNYCLYAPHSRSM